MSFDGNCEIRRAGVGEDGRIILDLKADNNAFDWTWFRCKQEIGREGLAIALTAITANKHVYCLIPTPETAWSDVTSFMLVK